MKEAQESGAPAYLLTVRGSVHISQSDFSLLYKGITDLLLKATVDPQRAIDLNISASLEFLRLVAPDVGAGKTLINRCMTDEGLLETELLEEVPNEHRPTDQWIAARLKVPHEFRTRLRARHLKRLKRNEKGENNYSTGDEVWMHFKPTAKGLEKWIREEDRGEERIDSDHAMQPGARTGDPATHELHGGKDSPKGVKQEEVSCADAPRDHQSENDEVRGEDESKPAQFSQDGLSKEERNCTL